MRAPTRDELSKERALRYALLADTGMTALLIVVAIGGGSLTILGEATRSVLMLAIQYYSLWVLSALHRGRLDRFEFGAGKIEQFVWLLVGLGLVASGLWIAQTVVGTIFAARPAASPLGLSLAAVTNAINAVINVLFWWAVVTASREGDSQVYRAQIRARLTMMTSSLVLQVTLTAAALAKDSAIALILDAAGAVFVVAIMLHAGISMIIQALPSLVDAPAAADLRAQIRRTVAGIVAESDILSIRTRRTGPTTFAEVALRESAFPSIDALRDSVAEIRQALGHNTASVEITIVVGSP